jgi:hypothetical protein
VEPRRRSLGGPLALLAALAIALAAVGCGADEEKKTGAEGEHINVGDAVYQVQLTRLLEPTQRPDNDYLRGQPALARDQRWLGVFLTIENEGDGDYTPPRDMKVVDTEGNEYLPIDTSSTGFGLSLAEAIPPGDGAPLPDSPAQSGPVGGALLLFRVSETSATENLPLVLEIPAPDGKTTSKITLDV